MEIYWEVPILRYPEVCEMLWECLQAEREGNRTGADELREAIRMLPGYPTNYNPQHDVIMVVPKGAKISIQPHSGIVGNNEKPLKQGLFAANGRPPTSH